MWRIRMKRHLPKIIGLLLFGMFIFAIMYSSHTFLNEEDTIGNSAGNLLNGGLFCENDGVIYFSNPNDGGSLYSMDLNCENVKKVYQDKAAYINAAGKYIVYVRKNYERENGSGDFYNLNSTGIYRITKNGNQIECLYTDPAEVTALRGNYIYYQHYNKDEGLKFYKVKLDGSDETILSNEPIVPAAFTGNKLFYCGVTEDMNLHVMNLDNDSSRLLHEDDCYHVLTDGNYLYYISLSHGYSIVKMNFDGTEPTILVNEQVSFMNLSVDERYLYYQVDGGNHNRFCRLDLETLETETLLEGDYNSIHTTTNYVFFREFESEQFYKLSTIDGSITEFNPPVEQ